MGIYAVADIWYEWCLFGFAEQWGTFCESEDESPKEEKKSYIVGL